MTKFVLMGAGGNLGGVAADFAIELAKPEDHLVFASSNLDKVPTEKVARWRSKGVEVMSASYDDLDSMRKAFEGAEAVATISTWLIGDRRRNQIKNALDVAKELGVKRFCYTSGAGAGVKAEKEEDIPYLLRDHHFIEQLIYASGLEYNTSLVFVGTFSLLYGVAASDNISVVKTQRLHWRVLPAMS